jgi:uncharacterized protein YbjQ (UPF0145 family)
MITTTTGSVEGRKIEAYLGIVAGEAILGANFLKDFFANISDIFGGRSSAYEKEFVKARAIALEQMTAAAQELGGNAVVGVDLDYQVIGGDHKTLLMVSMNGTAVKLS